MKETLVSMALALAAVVPLCAQDEPRFEERVDVNLVQLDVTVTDEKGNQILGLDRDDFIVTENGNRVTIVGIDYFTNRRLLDVPEDQAAFKVERVHDRRYFVIMLHTIPDPTFRLDFQRGIQMVRRASIDFVKNRIRDKDLVAVVGYNTRLKIYSDFTPDRGALAEAIEEAMTFSNGISETPETPVESGILANMDMKTMINSTTRVQEGIRMLANALNAIPARKVLLLFTPGVGEPALIAPRIPRNDIWFGPMMGSLQRANVTVFAMHLLPGGGGYAADNNLISMARDTGGGYYRQATSFVGPLKQIENENNGYYMLSYYVKPSDALGMVDLQVELKNSEFKVKARKGR